MNPKNIKLLHTVYSIVTSVMIALSALMLIISCVSIYNSGDRPFTRESVADAFSRISVPIFITLALIVGAVVITVIFPLDRAKPKKAVNERMLLEIYRQTLKKNGLPALYGSKIREEKIRRFFLILITVAVWVGSVIYPLIYLLDPQNFKSENVNSEVAAASIVIIIFIAAPIILSIAVSFLLSRSRRREIEISKEAVKEARNSENIEKYEESDCEKKCEAFFARLKSFFEKNEGVILLVARLSILSLSLVFIVLGAFNGGMADVFSKAVKICTECIGMG